MLWDLFHTPAGAGLHLAVKIHPCAFGISAPKLAPSGGSSAVEQRTVKCASAAILWSGVQISLSGFLEVFGTRCAGVLRGAVQMSYGHTTVKAPHPIRTAKLSTVGPDQYYGRGLRGNLRCCKAFFCHFAMGVVQVRCAVQCSCLTVIPR